MAHIPDADATKQRTVAYLSSRGRGNRCFCRHELITIVTPLSRPSSAKTAASVCLYSVYRKQERSLFTAALEQTSNMPTAIIRPRLTAGLWSPIPSIRLAIASLRHATHLLFDRCATAPETRPLLAISRAHPSRVQRRPTGGGGDSPTRRPGADGHCASPVTLPRNPPVRFGRATADYVDRPQAALVSRHRPGTAPGPSGDRPSPLLWRSNSNHAGKSSYSGEIDYRFLSFQTGSRF